MLRHVWLPVVQSGNTISNLNIILYLKPYVGLINEDFEWQMQKIYSQTLAFVILPYGLITNALVYCFHQARWRKLMSVSVFFLGGGLLLKLTCLYRRNCLLYFAFFYHLVFKTIKKAPIHHLIRYYSRLRHCRKIIIHYILSAPTNRRNKQTNNQKQKQNSLMIRASALHAEDRGFESRAGAFPNC